MSNKKSLERKPSSLITKIEIEKLFGRYDYDLEIPQSSKNDFSNIGIIYGDNGTGKTTILKLLFHLLSTAEGREHRTFLAQTPFLRFSVIFSDRTKISALRKGFDLDKPYELKISKPKSEPINAIVPVEDGVVKSVPDHLKNLHAAIDELGLTIFFLSENRTLYSDEIQVKEQFEEEFLMATGLIRTQKVIRDPHDAALPDSLNRIPPWLRQRYIQESSRGEAEAQQIYINIVKALKHSGVPKTEDSAEKKKKLIKELKELNEKSRIISKFGLVSKIKTSSLLNILTTTEPDVLPFVIPIVSSFIDGQKVRLNALEELNNILNRFIKLINGFFIDKKIDLTLDKGISISTDSGMALDPNKLSSGEKQLLLLFSNILTSSETASLFIIDEPEISLNVKWQRRLVDALIDLTDRTQCQFLLATHSIELLTKHRNQVNQLKPFKIK